MVTEVLAQFQNATVVNRCGNGAVLVILQNRARRICKAQIGSDEALARPPILERKAVGGKLIGPRARHHRRSWQQVPINRPRQVSRVDVDVVCRNRHAACDLPFDSQRSLLRLWVPIVRLAGEEYGSRRVGAGICNPETELLQVSGRDASGCVTGRSAAQNLSLGKQRLENPRGAEPWNCWNAGKRNHCIGNLADAVDFAQILQHGRNRRVDRGVETPEPAADFRLLGAEGVPSKRNAGRKVLLVGSKRRLLGVQCVAQAVVQRKIWPNVPCVLPIGSCKRPALDRNGVAETLFVERGQAQTPGLKGAYGGGVDRIWKSA